MAVNVIMLQAGQDLETGIVRQWLKAEGDVVAKGEAIVQIDTEKVSLEVEAPAAGAQTETAIFSVIGIIGQPGEDLSSASTRIPGRPASGCG